MDVHARAPAREQRLTVNEGSGRHRLAAWREAIGGTASIEIDAAVAVSFQGGLRSRIIGPLMALRISADTFRFARDEVMARGI